MEQAEQEACSSEEVPKFTECFSPQPVYIPYSLLGGGPTSAMTPYADLLYILWILLARELSIQCWVTVHSLHSYKMKL